MDNAGFKEFIRLMKYMKPRLKLYLLGLFGQSISFGSLYIVLAFVLMYLVDAAQKGDMLYIFQALKLVGLTMAILIISVPIFYYIFKYSVRGTMADIKGDAFSKVQRLKLSYFDANHSGEIIARLTNDMLIAEKAYSDNLMEVVTTTLLGLVSAVIMLYVNWKIAVVLIVLGAALSAVNLLFAGPLRRLSGHIQEHKGVMNEQLTNQLSGFFLLKLFEAKGSVKNKFDDENKAVTELSVKRTDKRAILDGTSYFLSKIGFGGTLAIGAIIALKGDVDFSALAAIVQFQLNVNTAFLKIGQYFSNLQISLASAGRIFEILDQEEETQGMNTSAGDCIITEKAIEMKDVVFSYNMEEKALNHYNMLVEKGRVAALVGPSGGGKSTVAKLLLGFYPVSEGEIYIAGRPVSEYSPEKLSRLIAYVPQEAYLFTGSIRENIMLGCISASEEEILTASKAANAHDFIMELPQGYETQVGESGAMLSGGQRQRIAIARAFLKNSPILILDEATSALDSENEQFIKNALDSLIKDRTVIMIAHRLSTIEKADRIYVVHSGKVAEEGTRRELLDKGGLFSYLCNIQNLCIEK